MTSSDVHFLLIPLMCPGHLIPMVDMAKLISQHSVTVTILITPRNALRYAAVLRRAISSGLPIRTLHLPFPATDAGLPHDCESIDELPSFSLSKNFFNALALLQKPLEQAFQHLTPPPNCIISDKHLTWTSDIAKKFEIPWVIFDGMSCFTQLCTHNLCLSKIHERVPETEPFVLPGLPDCIKMTKVQLPGLFNPGNSARSIEMKAVRERVRAAEVGAYGVLINTFDDLEKPYIHEYRKVVRDKVWCIGPFSLSNKNDLDKAQRGNKASIDDYSCLKWLDSQPRKSVMYACLGSLARLAPPQFVELALGLEQSGSAFMLVLKEGREGEEIERWLSEDGLEERVEGRGVLVRGWAPQVVILSHRSVGGFLTHCGWNSTIEGVCAGVPMATWPQFAEQFLNERLVVDVLRSGVSVGAQRVVHLGQCEDGDGGVQVKREDVCEAVKMVMDGGEEGEERRRRAKGLMEMGRMAMEEGGSSQMNISMFIQDIMSHINNDNIAFSRDF